MGDDMEKKQIFTETEGEYIRKLIGKDADKGNYTDKERRHRVKLMGKIDDAIIEEDNDI